MISFKKQIIFKFIISLGLVLTIIILSYAYLLKKNNRTECPNVLLITIDALRSDHLSCYGYKRETSPNIDDLGKKGVIFTQAISQAPVTIPSMPSLMTSLYPSQHGVKMYTRSSILVPTLPEILKANGYYTMGIVAHELRHTGITRGFDFIYFNRLLKANIVTQKAVNWLNKNKDKRFFLWLHYFDPHAPYTPPPTYDELFLPVIFKEKGKEYLAKRYYWVRQGQSPKRRLKRFKEKGKEYLAEIYHWFFLGEPPKPTPKFKEVKKATFIRVLHPVPIVTKQTLDNNLTEEDREYYISQYDGEIRFTDDQIGILFAELKRLGLDEKTLIILTADHGENLADYNKYFFHGDALYDVALRVPLIIKGSGLPQHKIIERQVQMIDIMPTIFDILKIRVKIKIEGFSLLPLILDKMNKIRDYAFSEILGAGKILKSIRTEDWKLIYNLDEERYELYNLRSDPQEQHNLVNLEKEKLKSLKAELKKWMRRVRSAKSPLAKPLDEKTKQNLRSLGYVQ